MKLGVENKRNVILLSVLGLGALYGVYSNFSDSSSGSSPSVPAATAVAPPTIGSSAADSDQPAPPRARRRNEEWHPVVHSKNKDEQVPTDKIDPTLHLDLLTKVLASKPAGGARNLFEFGAAKLSTVPTPALLAKNEPKITGPKPMGPPPLPPPPPPPGPYVAPPLGPLPPLNALYYGFAAPSSSNHRRGFFMMPPEHGPAPPGAAGPPSDEQIILIKAEGEILTGHYKIIKLESGSVTVEDTDSKRTKTLQIVADASD